jgi:hypothetical protein
LSATILAIAVALSSTNASAISSYTSTSLTCGSIQALIRGQGAIILRRTSKKTGNPLYNRYVRNGNYCNVAQTAMPTYIPASDTNNCRVYYCAKRETNCDYRRRC